MAQKWNRETRRKMSRYGIGQETVEQVFETEYGRVRAYAYYNAWVSMLLALVKRHPRLRNARELHSLAVDTLEICNGAAPPSELAARLLEETGFDIYEKPSESDVEYAPPGAQGEWLSDYTSRSYRFRCSICGAVVYYPQAMRGEKRRQRICRYRLCPQCGSEMKGAGADDRDDKAAAGDGAGEGHPAAESLL